MGTYATLIGIFNTLFVGFLLATRSSKRELPESIQASDIVLLGIATHKASRLITRDIVTSVVRAPFTEFQEPANENELNEQPRGTGWRYTIGKLLSCPFCIGQWIASFFAYGLVLAPRPTRIVASIFTIVTLSDLLHLVYAAGQNRVK